MPTSSKSYVCHQEVPRDYRTEIPNIVFEMLSLGLISNSDFIIYSFYRRVDTEQETCSISMRDLKEKTHLSEETLAKSKAKLSSTFKIMNGKSLITMNPSIDHRPDNYQFFNKGN